MNIEILESRIAPAVLTVTSLLNSGAGSIVTVIGASHAGDKIVFAPSLTGGVIALMGQVDIEHPLTIVGPGAGKLSISGSGIDGIFNISGFLAPGAVSISGLTLTDGTETASVGGAIDSLAPLTLKNCVISGNTAGEGGGVYARTTTVTITDCEFVKNSTNTAAGYGGGVDVLASKSAIITGSQFIGNKAASSGGGIYALAGNAGSGVVISNDIVTGNTSLEVGGGIGLDTVEGAKATVSGCVVSGNVASNSGGGVYGKIGNFVLTNNVLTGNQAISEKGG